MLKFFGKWFGAGAFLASGFIATAFALTSLERDLTATGMDQPTLHTFLSNVVTKVNALDASTDDLVGSLDGDNVLSDPGCSSSTTDMTHDEIIVTIGGVMVFAAADASVTLGDSDTTDNGEVAGYALDIGLNGTVDAIAAADNAGGNYTTAAEALAALPAVASDHVRLCTLTVVADTGTFVAQTDAIDDSNTTATFTDTAQALAALTAVSDTDDLTLSRP